MVYNNYIYIYIHTYPLDNIITCLPHQKLLSLAFPQIAGVVSAPPTARGKWTPGSCATCRVASGTRLAQGSLLLTNLDLSDANYRRTSILNRLPEKIPYIWFF